MKIKAQLGIQSKKGTEIYVISGMLMDHLPCQPVNGRMINHSRLAMICFADLGRGPQEDLAGPATDDRLSILRWCCYDFFWCCARQGVANTADLPSSPGGKP